MARGLVVRIIGDASSYVRALNQSTNKTQTFGSTMKRMGGAAAFAAGSAGIAGLTIAVHNGIREWVDQAKVTAQTEAVLKSTGHAAGITAKHVEALAGQIMRYSGIDDEAVQATENLILGFKGVRNEAGKGMDIFDRLTKVVVDYSVRTGKDARGAAILFGKALNEIAQGQVPASIRGIGKLSESLQAEIKAHIAAGDTAGAQALLLGKLEKSYGGAAEAAGKTLPGQLSILREEFNNLAGKGIAVAVKEMEDLRPAIETFIGVVQTLMPILKPLAKLMIDVFVTPMKVITDLIRGDWTAAWGDFKAPVMDAVNFVKAVVAPLVPFFTGVWNAIRTATSTALEAIKTNVTAAWNAIKDSTLSVWNGIVSAIAGALASAKNLAVSGGHAIMAGLLGALRAGWNAITGWLSDIPGFFRSFFGGAGSWLYDAGKRIMEGLFSGLIAAWKKVQDFISGIGGWITSHKGPLSVDLRLLEPAGRAIMAGLHSGMAAGMHDVMALTQGIAPTIGVSAIGAAGAGVGGGAVNIYMTVEGSLVHQNDLPHFIVDAIRQYTKQNGPLLSRTAGAAI